MVLIIADLRQLRRAVRGIIFGMAENIDGGKKRKHERGKKRTINSLGDLGSQQEILNMLAASAPQPTEQAQREIEARGEKSTAPDKTSSLEMTPSTENNQHSLTESYEPHTNHGDKQTDAGLITEPETRAEAVWERLMRENPEGDADNAFGRTAWFAPDGGIYLSRRNSNRPSYYAHGDKITFSTGERKGQTLYWDTHNSRFDEARPHDIVDTVETTAQERRLSARERRLNQPLSEKAIDTAQHNLRARLQKLAMEDSNRGVFSQGINAVKTQGHVKQISELLSEFDAVQSRRTEKSMLSETSPIQLAAPVSNDSIQGENLEYAQGNLRKRLDELTLDEDARESISLQIAAAASSKDIVQLSKVIKRRETAERKSKTPSLKDASQTTELESASNSLDDVRHRESEVRTPSSENTGVNTEAQAQAGGTVKQEVAESTTRPIKTNTDPLHLTSAAAPAAPHAPATPNAPSAGPALASTSPSAPPAFSPSAPVLPDFKVRTVPSGGRATGRSSGTIQPMGLDRFRAHRENHRAYEKKKNTLNPITGAESEDREDRTIADIFSDPAEKKSFINDFLGSAANNVPQAQDVINAITDNTQLSEAQDKWLDKMRKEYNVKIRESEQVKEFLTPEMYKNIADSDPRIAEIVGKIGIERAETLIDGELKRLMISDPKAFNKLKKALKDEHDLDNSPRRKKLEDDIDTKLRTLNLSEDQYMEATRVGSQSEIEKLLNQKIHDQMPRYQQAINFGNWLTKRSSQELYMHYKSQSDILKESDMHMKAIGSVLRSTFTPELRMRIQKLAFEGVIDTAPVESVGTIEEYRAAKHENAESTIQSGFDAYKLAEGAKHNISDWTAGANPAKLDALKDTYAKAVYEKQKNHKASGMFALLLQLLFGQIKSSDDIKKNIK